MTIADIELKGLSREQISNLLPEGLISLCWRGSVAHGMYVPKSDPDSIDHKDIMGIYIGPLEHYIGFGRKDVYEQWEGEWDCVFYELKKFIGLLLNCNPNVLSLLWLKPNGIIYEGSLGQRLRENREEGDSEVGAEKQVRRAAELDVAEAQVWYEAQQAGLGADFHSEISQIFTLLTETPLSGDSLVLNG